MYFGMKNVLNIHVTATVHSLDCHGSLVVVLREILMVRFCKEQGYQDEGIIIAAWKFMHSKHIGYAYRKDILIREYLMLMHDYIITFSNLLRI